MNTFCAVDDQALTNLIRQAQRRIVLIAPGLFLEVAKALCDRFKEVAKLEVSVILDASDEVCRIGFGELEAVKLVHQQAEAAGFYVRSQPGLRVGVLLVDEQTLVWSPTPRSVEATPDSSIAAGHGSELAPNGLMLGIDPGHQIAQAVCAEGTETDPRSAEIGTSPITPDQVAAVTASLANNPPIPVDLARITRVFSTKLQFVELKVTRARLSQQQISLSSSLLNADASEQLRGLLDSKLKAFSELRDREVDVPVFVNGVQAFDREHNPLLERVSEAGLNRERHAIEAEYLYDVPGFGRVLERARRFEFEKRIEAFKVRLLGHSEGLRKTLADEAAAIVDDAVELIAERMARAGAGQSLTSKDHARIKESLQKNLSRAENEAPKVNLVFKEVTFEQTQDGKFKAKLDKALPPLVKRRLGTWYEDFSAARQAAPGESKR